MMSCVTCVSLLVLFLGMASTTDLQDYVSGSTNLALKLFALINDQPDASNVFFSPYSITTAMAMLYTGSKGATRTEIAEVCGFIDDVNVALDTAHDLDASLFSGDNEYILKSANKLYMDRGLEVHKDYIVDIKDGFNADADQVDFKTNAAAVREDINQWVSDKTSGSITDFLPSGAVKPSTAAILLNAVYFKADWLYKFDVAETSTDKFNLRDGSSQDVLMMHLGSTSLKMAAFPEFNLSVLQIPYVGNQVNMYIVLPDEGQDIKTVGKSLNTSAVLDGLFNSLYKVPVSLVLPKLTVTQKMPLIDLMKALGLSRVFTGEADLSHIAPNLMVSNILHQGYLSIDEEGTQASAATGITMTRMSARQFAVNRPFMVFIRQEETGALLFAGRIVDPGTTTQPLKLRMIRSLGSYVNDMSNSGTVLHNAAWVILSAILICLHG